MSLSSSLPLPSRDVLSEREPISVDSELLDRRDEYSSTDSEALADCLSPNTFCPIVVQPGLIDSPA